MDTHTHTHTHTPPPTHTDLPNPLRPKGWFTFIIKPSRSHHPLLWDPSPNTPSVDIRHPRPAQRPPLYAIVQQPGALEQDRSSHVAQLYTNPSSLEGLPGPCPWHLLQPLTRTPAPQQYSRLSRSRCRVLLAPAEDGVAACLPHRSSSSASPARLEWHLALSTLPGVPGRAPGPAGTGTKSSGLSPTQPGLNTPIQPCCPGCSCFSGCHCLCR